MKKGYIEMTKKIYLATFTSVLPTVLLWNILTWQIFHSFKTAMISRLFYNKPFSGSFSPVAFAAAISVFPTLLFLALEHFSPFEVMAFIGKTLVEETKLTSFKYILQLIIWQYGWQGCFIPKTSHFICSRLALGTDNFMRNVMTEKD